MSKSVPKFGWNTPKNQKKSTSTEKKMIILETIQGQRSHTTSDGLGWPRHMTGYTRWIIDAVFVSDIDFDLNNDPEAQIKVKIVTTENEQRKWLLTCVTLAPRKIYMTFRYPHTLNILYAMNKNTLESKKIYSANSCDKSQNIQITTKHDVMCVITS